MTHEHLTLASKTEDRPPVTIEQLAALEFSAVVEFKELNDADRKKRAYDFVQQVYQSAQVAMAEMTVKD